MLKARRQHGFTILELMITIGIFSILTAAAMPTLRTWIANNRVRSAADSLQNGLRLAQSESLRRSRQVVFSLTASTSPQGGFTAVANGPNWSANTVPSMTDGSETQQYVDSGVVINPGTAVTVTGPAAICFNSIGRMVANVSAGVTAITGGATCAAPANQQYRIDIAGVADKPLAVNVGLGGQVHLCDPSRSLSSTNPDGC